MSDHTKKSEKEKMLSGEPYLAFDSELLKERNLAKNICFQLNQTSPLDSSKRLLLTKQLLGKNLVNPVIESPFHVDYGYNLKVGQNFYANHGCTILDCNQIEMGDNCLLAPHVVISAATHPLSAEERLSGYEFAQPIHIGDNCWIGANATINPGVTLGNNVIVGAGAVVTKSFPEDNIILAGVPAKIIRKLDNK